jgi:hypothetical protein
MQQEAPHSRRFSSRVDTSAAVYVCWGCAGYDDTSEVRDLGSGGLFLLTEKLKAVGSKASVHFLVEEGPIRAEAIVRHVKPGRGLGLEFTAVWDVDRKRLADLMRRVREFGLFSKFQSNARNQQAPLQ